MGEATAQGFSSRAARREHVRRAMVDAALRRFLDAGYEDTTLDDICARLLVSPRTLQRYVGGKERLALDWQYRALDRFRRGIAARPPEQLVTGWWRGYLLDLADRNERNDLSREQHRLVQSVPTLHSRHLSIIREYEDVLTEAIAAEQPQTGHILPRLTALVLLGASEAAFDEWVYGGHDRSLRVLSMEALDAGLAELVPHWDSPQAGFSTNW